MPPLPQGRSRSMRTGEVGVVSWEVAKKKPTDGVPSGRGKEGGGCEEWEDRLLGGGRGRVDGGGGAGVSVVGKCCSMVASEGGEGRRGRRMV